MKRTLTLAMVAVLSSVVFSGTVSLQAPGPNEPGSAVNPIPLYGTVTIPIVTDIKLLTLDAIITIEGPASIIDYLDVDNAEQYGWDAIGFTAPAIPNLPKSVEIGAASFSDPPSGVVGFVTIQCEGPEPVTVSIEPGIALGGSVDITFGYPDFNEPIIIYQDDGSKELVDLQITGPGDVNENSQTQYHAVAYFQDGFNYDVTGGVIWSNTPNDVSTVDSNGLLTTEILLLPEKQTTLSTEYTFKDVTLTAIKDVNIVVPLILDELIERNLTEAIGLKLAVLDDILLALDYEQATQRILAEKQLDRSLPMSEKRDILMARIKLFQAMLKQRFGYERIDSSIDDLDAVLQ